MGILFLLLSGASPSFAATSFIVPRHPVIPFNQWQANNGYCGEVSLIQAGLNQGQWMSQYNARLICGTGLSQSGPDGFCAANDSSPNYNAQMLLENPNPGDQPFGNASLCLQNSRLAFETFDYSHQPAGMAGYQQFMSWVKAQMIAGNQVTLSVLDKGGKDSQYDHEVTVTKISTRHDIFDSTYYPDDVLYFDEHHNGGTALTNGYRFGDLAKTRNQANALNASTYSILIPGETPIYSYSGGDGANKNPRPLVGANFGFAVSGPADLHHETLPVTLKIIASSVNGIPNTVDPTDGFNFESPEIANGDENACTNAPPRRMNMTLEAHVEGLTAGKSYRLFEYDFDRISGVGFGAGLAVPDSDFNAHQNLAKKMTEFVAKGPTFVQTIQTTSDKIIVLRCVEASAP